MLNLKLKTDLFPIKNFGLFLVLFITLGLFQSCQKDNDVTVPEDKVAPQLPPPSSFIMPFNGFEDADTSEFNTGGEAGARSVTYHNWFYAASNVVVWNTFLTINMAIPVATFVESFNHEPLYIGDGVWAWDYNVVDNNGIFTVRLTGEFINNNEEVEWVMTVSKDGAWQNVEFYRGQVRLDDTGASWTLNHQPFNPQPCLSIEYVTVPGSEEGTIRYTNIIPNDPGNGHYIEFRNQPGADYNRAYDVFQGDNFLEILWNEPTFEGRVKNEVHFGDDEWHCWDEEALDVDC